MKYFAFVGLELEDKFADLEIADLEEISWGECLG